MAKKLPKVSIIDRRLENPFGSPSIPITLREGGPWEVRWFHAKLRPGRIHDAVQNKGWAFVEASELDGNVDEFGFTLKDNRVVRGEHGEEVLMKMLKSDFDKIQHAKAERNLRGLGKQALRESAAQATANQYGSEAGDSVYSHMDVKASKGEDLELEESA